MAAAVPFLGPAMMGIGGIASLFGKGKGKKQEYSPVGGKDTLDFNRYFMDMLKQKMNRPRPVALPNMMMKNALGGVGKNYGMDLSGMFTPKFFNPQTGAFGAGVPGPGARMPGGLPSPAGPGHSWKAGMPGTPGMGMPGFGGGGMPRGFSGGMPRTPYPMAPRPMMKI